MREEQVVCDGCISTIEKPSRENRIEYKTRDDKGNRASVDLCGDCLKKAVDKYLSSRKRPLMSSCNCDDGKIREYDRDASMAVATCGESRSQYKVVKCDKCVF